MSDYPFPDADWEELHNEIQKRLHALSDEICALAPSIQPRFSRTVTELFPLFSYVSFRRPSVDEGEYIIVGADVIPKDGQWRIDADICDEEEGTIYFELPNTPFSVASFEELKDRVLDAVEQLIREGKPVLLRLFGSMTPPAANGVASMPELARKV